MQQEQENKQFKDFKDEKEERNDESAKFLQNAGAFFFITYTLLFPVILAYFQWRNQCNISLSKTSDLRELYSSIESLRKTQMNILIKLGNQEKDSMEVKGEIEKLNRAVSHLEENAMVFQTSVDYLSKQEPSSQASSKESLSQPETKKIAYHVDERKTKNMKRILSRRLQSWKSCEKIQFSFEINSIDPKISWKLINERSGFVEMMQNNDIQDHKLSSVAEACVDPGIYSFEVFDVEGNQVYCEQNMWCYNISINSTILIEGGSENANVPHKFIVPSVGNIRRLRCPNGPFLSPINQETHKYDERLNRLLEVLYTVSASASLRDRFTPQYNAACYIMYDDVIELDADDKQLTERYILAIFLSIMEKNVDILIPGDACHFVHVMCNSEGYFVHFDFEGLNIQGTIPTELSKLRFLETLNIAKNGFVGTIPPQLGMLENLIELNLSHNGLTRSIPSDLCQISTLKVLKLQFNQISGTLPAELGDCHQLEILEANSNKLEGTLPPELFKVNSLQVLLLFNNLLTGKIPSTINQLSNLRWLYLDNNFLTGTIPREVQGLTNLRIMYIYMNRLIGTLPEEIGQLTHLKRLDLSNNELTGELPNIFGNLVSLESLRLTNNNFFGPTPSSLWNASLDSLIIDSNQMVGSMPTNYCARMIELVVDNSAWFLYEPKIKCECCSTANCYMWDVKEPLVGGTIRPECPEQNQIELIGFEDVGVHDLVTNTTLTQFLGIDVEDKTTICLSPNGCYSFSGNRNFTFGAKHSRDSIEETCEAVSICETFFETSHPKRAGLNHLTQLVHIETTGVVREALCWIMTKDPLFHALDVCDGTLLQRFILVIFYYSFEGKVNFNSFSSKTTCEWEGVTCDLANKYVEHLILPNHGLNGTLATELGFLKMLKTINLNQNGLNGTFIPFFSYMQDLEIFDIGDNQLEGTLPTDLLSLPQLNHVNLSHNLFTGTIPDDITYSKLVSFDTASNLLWGSIPKFIMSDSLQLIDLSRNNLAGEIPSELSTLVNLKTLKLHENQLSGRLPEGVFMSTQIESIMLQSNKLTGSIPTKFGKMNKLKVLTMNHNNFRGLIPPGFSELKNLDLLHLHHNELTGDAPSMTFHNKNKNNYITDCGEPSFHLLQPLFCETCTICCNSDEECLDRTEFPMWIIAVSVSFGTPLLFLIVRYIVSKMKDSWSEENRDILSLYHSESVYCFLLSQYYSAWTLIFFIGATQVSLLIVFFNASDKRGRNTDAQFTYQCPATSLECHNVKSIDPAVWIPFGLLILFYLGNDIAVSMLQLWNGVVLRDIQLCVSGILLFWMALLTIFTSYVYNEALAETNTDLIVNAVILLFITELDESCLNILRIVVPNWTAFMLEEVALNMSRKVGERSSIHNSTPSSQDIKSSCT